MAVRDTEDYYTQLFGGGDAPYDSGTGGNQFGVTDPAERSPDPGSVSGNYGLIPSTDTNPETGFRWNSPEDLAATNKLYGGASGGQPVESWLQQYQVGNQATEGLDRTLQGLQASGYNAQPFMYGNTPSGNELLINGEKQKIISENGGNPEWYQWGSNDNGGGGSPGFGGYTAGGGSSGGVGATGFADPSYNQLNDLVNRRLAQLQQPQSNPQMEAYFASLMQEKALAKQRAQAFADQLTQRIGQLQQPLLSQGDSARIRAQYQNGTQAERDRALAANRERLAIRGFDPRTSGLLEGTNRATNAAYDARTGNIDATLANQAIMADEQRRNQATTLQQLAYNALNGGDLTSLQQQATAAEAERQQYEQSQARERELLTTGGIPVELSNTGLQNALATLGSGGGSSSALQSLFGALGLAQQQQSLDQANTASLFGGAGGLLASILPYILPKRT